MSAIEKFKQAKENADRAEKWFALLGKEYFGGTRGKGGEYGSFGNTLTSVGPLEIYYQEYDGAQNYHGVPKPLGEAIGNILKNTQPGREVIKMAVQRLRELATSAAQEAQKEHEQLMIEAGIPTKPEQS